jgi:hypothetical protein
MSQHEWLSRVVWIQVKNAVGLIICNSPYITPSFHGYCCSAMFPIYTLPEDVCSSVHMLLHYIVTSSDVPHSHDLPWL